MTTTTSATTSTAATTAETIAKANATAASNLIKSLGAGSGIDTAALASNLVDAEKIPKETAINAKITKSEAKISGYAAMAYSVGQLKDAFAALNDVSDFNSLAVSNSNPSSFNVTTSSTAATGDYQLQVTQLAQPQRSVSDGFSDTTTALSASAFSLTLSVNGASPSTKIPVTAANSSPAGIVDAINKSGHGLTAQLINKGDGSATPFRIILTGPNGASQNFTLGSDDGTDPLAETPITGLSFNTASPLQVAKDAKLTVNGVEITRSSNVVSDAVKGLTINLTAVGSASSLSLTRDTSSLKEKVTALVAAYNDANTMFNVVSDKASTVDQYGGSLFGDSTVRTVRDQVRSMVLGTSNTPGTNASQLWQMGISLTSTGTLEVDNTKLDAALTGNFDGVVKMMTGNTQGLSTFSVAPAGIAGEAMRKLAKLTAYDGVLTTQSTNATTQIDKYKVDLETLQTRMTQLLARYQAQFAAMDSMVGESNSTRASLKSTFDGMANAYKA